MKEEEEKTSKIKWRGICWEEKAQKRPQSDFHQVLRKVRVFERDWRTSQGRCECEGRIGCWEGSGTASR